MKDKPTHQELQALASSGDLLIDFDYEREKVRPWVLKKKQTMLLADSHRRIAQKSKDFDSKAGKLCECGNYLDYRYFPETGDKKLAKANFCKYRLCPMCAWRRSLKIFGQASQVLDEVKKQKYEFIFVTLTQENCGHKELGQEITNIVHGLRLLMRRKAIKKVVHGWMRIIEITHNVDPLSKSYDTFHPHVHMIWAVKRSYFKEGYVSQAELVNLWQKCMKLEYKPITDIRRVRTKGKGHIREVAKYSVKPGEMLTDDWDLTDRAVYTLDESLHNRRLLAWGGIIKEVRKTFKFDDPESGDLVNTDSDKVENPELQYILIRYRWNVGYQQYLKSKESVWDPSKNTLQL